MNRKHLIGFCFALTLAYLAACSAQHAGTTDETESGQKVALTVKLDSVQAKRLSAMRMEIWTDSAGPQDSALLQISADSLGAFPSVKLSAGAYKLVVTGLATDTAANSAMVSVLHVTLAAQDSLNLDAVQLTAAASISALMLNGKAMVARGYHCGILGTGLWSIVDSLGQYFLAGIPSGTQSLSCQEIPQEIVQFKSALNPGEQRVSTPLVAAKLSEPLWNILIDTMYVLPDSLRGKDSVFYSSKPVLMRYPNCVDNCTVGTAQVKVTKEPLTGIDLGIVVEGMDSVYTIPAGVWGYNAFPLLDADHDGKLQLVAIPYGTWCAGFDWFP